MSAGATEVVRVEGGGAGGASRVVRIANIEQLAQAVAAIIGTGGTGGGTTDHTQLSNRDAANQHPLAAIAGLVAALEGKSATTHGHLAFVTELPSSGQSLTTIYVRAAGDDGDGSFVWDGSAWRQV